MEILDTIEHYTLQSFAFGVLFLGGVITILSWAAAPGSWQYTGFKIYVLSLTASYLVFVILCIVGTFTKFDHTEYIVRTDDSVTVNELYDKYIIDKKEPYSNVFHVRENVNE